MRSLIVMIIYFIKTINDELIIYDIYLSCLGIALTLYWGGVSTIPNSYFRGSMLSLVVSSGGRNVNLWSNVATKRKSRFLARASPGHTRLPAPNGSNLGNKKRIFSKETIPELHISLSITITCARSINLICYTNNGMSHKKNVFFINRYSQ